MMSPEEELRNFEAYSKGVARKTPASLGMEVTALDFLEQLSPCPIDPITHNGVQVHPPTVKRKGGFVATTRTFGYSTGDDPVMARAAAAYFSAEEMLAASNTYVHSYGTKEGFVKRLRELTTRKCKSPYSAKKIADKLEKLLPVNLDKIPDWNDADSLIQAVQLTHSSSAGAPYWKSKRDAYYECAETVLPIVMDAIGSGKLADLARTRPEWFLSECKNKLDRYEVAKLADKCRPYIAQPMHFSILFSALMQPFCGALKLWDQGNTYNAYGMSAMNGGLYRLVGRARKMHTKCVVDGKRRYMVGCYGDDGKIIEITPEGARSIDPDFRQMDGSVDQETVKGVCLYMRRVFERKWGVHGFWSEVLNLLVEFSCDPIFLVDGTSVFRKKQKDGIMSGVVGTTLFDTAKAAVAYSDLVDSLKAGTCSLTNAKKITEMMKLQHGLEIKEGTLNVATFEMYPEEGDLVSDNKFLGVRWVYTEREGEPVIVPYLRDPEWLSLIMVPRDDPHDQDIASMHKLSAFSKIRRAFDRARGLLITGAIYSERAKLSLMRVVDSIPGNAVVFQVEGGGGKGEVLSENATVVSSDFKYPSSSGCPTEDWVTSLYSVVPKGKMDEIFPELFLEAKWRARILSYKIMEKGAQIGLDYDETVEPEPADTHYDPNPLPPKNPPPIPKSITAQPRPLQDQSDFLANKLDAGVPATEKLFVGVQTSAVPSPRTGPQVELFSHEMETVLVSEIMDFCVKEHGKVVNLVPSEGETILSLFNRLTAANGLRFQWNTSRPDGQPVNFVELEVYDLKNPFEGGRMGKTSGIGSMKTQKSAMAEEFVNQWALFSRAWSSKQGLVAPISRKPPPVDKNPFQQKENVRPVAEARVGIPKTYVSEVHLQLTDWVAMAEYESYDKTFKTPAAPIAKDKLDDLKHQVKKNYTTTYEIERNEKQENSKSDSSGKSKCKCTRKSPSECTEGAHSKSKKPRRPGNVRSRGSTKHAGPSGPGHFPLLRD